MGGTAFSDFGLSVRARLRAATLSAVGVALFGAGAAPAVSVAAGKEELRPLDASELGLIAKLNGERQSLPGPDGEPLRALGVSTALTQAASDYAEYLRASDRFEHEADGRTAAERAREAGWKSAPGAALSVAEALFEGDGAEAAYFAWRRSPSHSAVLFHPDAHAVGLGHSGNKWVLLVGGRCVHSECAAMTGDPPADARVPLRTSRLRFLISRRGGTARVRVRLLRGEGRVLVSLRRADGRSARRLRVRRRGDLWRYAFSVSSEGRWTATIRFKARRGWTGRVVRRRLPPSRAPG